MRKGRKSGKIVLGVRIQDIRRKKVGQRNNVGHKAERLEN